MRNSSAAKPTQSIRVVWAFLRYLATHPRGVALVNATPPSAALVDPETRIPLADAARMLEAAIAATGDQAIGLHAAAFFEPKDRDPLEEAARNCTTLRAALECTIRYIRLLSDEATFSLHEEGESAIFRRHSTATGLALRVATDFAMTDMVQFLRRNTSIDESEIAIELLHAAPDYSDEYRRLFRCRVTFSARHNAMVFRRSQLETPMNSYCSVLARAFLERADGLLSRLAEGESVTERVRKLVAQHLSSGQVSMHWASRSLGVSPPTLRRYLEEENGTFSGIVEEVRRDIAERELRGRRNVGEIAFALGFSSLGAFDRAFRRWHGMLPTEYRTRHTAEGG
ncbi:MAG: AraC family transcriptional regulator [Deltaproteobacteria bacterium]|nr:AraC family transcriptional regulator [Deltaproteobacteria bacterium]